jgi:hypothetical protein
MAHPGCQPGLESLRVGVVGRLGRRGVKRGTELSHQDDLFVASEADAELPLWLVGVAEVVEECVEDMVQVFERRRVEPHVPLPRWIGQGQHNGYDVDSVVRYESVGFAQESERSDRGWWRHRRSWNTALGVRSRACVAGVQPVRGCHYRALPYAAVRAR